MHVLSGMFISTLLLLTLLKLFFDEAGFRSTVFSLIINYLSYQGMILIICGFFSFYII